jgi:hypothetical protein
VDPVPDPLLLRKSGSAGNGTLSTGPQRRSLAMRYATETEWGTWLRHYATGRNVLPDALGPGVYSASEGNEYRKMFLGSGALPARKADCLDNVGQVPHSCFRACLSVKKVEIVSIPASYFFITVCCEKLTLSVNVSRKHETFQNFVSCRLERRAWLILKFIVL